MLKSDKDIAKEFDNFNIIDIEFESDSSGWIKIEFPNADEHVGGGTDEVVDSFIIYDNNKIAFNNWYPENVYEELSNAIHTAHDISKGIILNSGPR